jgi:predicted transcriptional regulator
VKLSALQYEFKPLAPIPPGTRFSPATERHYSIAEIAEAWGLCWKTVRRLLDGEPGVVTIGHPGNERRRRYQTVRVPESVLARIHQRMRS